MFLLLGETNDPVCGLVEDALRVRGARTLRTSTLFGDSGRFRWWIEPSGMRWELELAEGGVLREEDVEGVLVRRGGWIASEGWSPRDLGYVHAEASAAVLGWLWSLRCPVVGRLRSAAWYRGDTSLLAWSVALRAAGLELQEALVTNDIEEARATCGESAVLQLFGPDVAYLVRAGNDWARLAERMERGPVCVTRPHGAVSLACVIGDAVIWASEPRPWLDARFVAFARDADLSFVELAVFGPAGREEVVGVDPQPRLARFGGEATERVAAHVCARLGASTEAALEVAS